MCVGIHFEYFGKNLCILFFHIKKLVFYNVIEINFGGNMTKEEVLTRIGYVRNLANLSARELSLRMGMSPQYMAQVEQGRIVLTVEKLLLILDICSFPVERFFSDNIEEYEADDELVKLIKSLPADKKKNLIELLK